MVSIVPLPQTSRFPVMKRLILGATVSCQERNVWMHMRNTGFRLKAVGARLVFSEMMTPVQVKKWRLALTFNVS